MCALCIISLSGNYHCIHSFPLPHISPFLLSQKLYYVSSLFVFLSFIACLFVSLSRLHLFSVDSTWMHQLTSTSLWLGFQALYGTFLGVTISMMSSLVDSSKLGSYWSNHNIIQCRQMFRRSWNASWICYEVHVLFWLGFCR